MTRRSVGWLKVEGNRLTFAEEEAGLGEVLSASGLTGGVKVAARLSPGKIVFRPLVEPEDVQTVCLEVAGDLRESAERLEELKATLPDPPEEVLEYKVPYTVEANVLGTLECVLSGGVEPAIRSLEEAGTTTAKDLQRDWELSKRIGRPAR
jgi:hypothetical protein